jgi:S-adenosylmethionine:tRNA ribosyltransferase-isomerase
MNPATWPRDRVLDDRLLLIEVRDGGSGGAWRDGRIADLPRWLGRRDLLVVNDAATIPASLAATTPRGQAVELRLAGRLDDGRWRAVLFGAGDWRTPTEDRPPPPEPRRGDRLRLCRDLDATIEEIDRLSQRLVVVRFSLSGAALWSAIYRHGRPVQYAHVAGPLEIWHAQTPFASRPWAVEMPSAGRPLTVGLIASLRRKGALVAAITHAAGLSSTGDPMIDAALPLPERYDIPRRTVSAIAVAHAGGGRVVAVGTTVVRALEGCALAHAGVLKPGEATTDLHVTASFRPQVVDGVLSGIHDTGSSHRQLLGAFAPEPLLSRAIDDAQARGYLSHEFGDACMILPSPSQALRARE